jgi:hypothetical protein
MPLRTSRSLWSLSTGLTLLPLNAGDTIGTGDACDALMTGHTLKSSGTLTSDTSQAGYALTTGRTWETSITTSTSRST